MTKDSALVSTKDIAKHLGVSRNFVYQLVEDKGLPTYKLGNRFRFRVDEVDEWLEKHQDEKEEVE